MEENIGMGLAQELRNAVTTIKTAILQSQARAVKTVNQEQLALYYGIGRFISENTRNNKWGTGALKSISERLKEELPGLRGFGVSSLKNMRLFFEAWNIIERNSPIAIGEMTEQHTLINTSVEIEGNEPITIRQLQLTNFPLWLYSLQESGQGIHRIYAGFPPAMGVATYKIADEMEPELLKVLPPKEELQRIFEESSKKEEGHR